MKKAITMLVAIVLIGCGDDARAETPQRTFDQTVTAIKSTDRVIVVPNTSRIDYAAYRQEWRRVNDKPAPKWAPDVKITGTAIGEKHDIVEVELSDLSFKEAFRLELLGKGEGHTFYWRGNEYTTNLLDVIRKPAFKHTDPYIERITPVNVKKTVETPTTEEPLKEGK